VLRCQQQWQLEHFLEEAREKTEKMNHFLGKLRIALQYLSMLGNVRMQIFNALKYQQ